MPLFKGGNVGYGNPDEVGYSELMHKKEISNDLVDYNLFLLRKIYDAFDDRGDKVVKQFRGDNSNILRKRYMIPVLNPSFDHEALLKENPIEYAEDKSVYLDGDDLCESEDK